MEHKNVPNFKWVLIAFVLAYLGTAKTALYGQIDFNKSVLDFNGFGPEPQVTSLMFGPDGRLYVLDYPGTVYVLTVERNGLGDYVVTAKETLTGVKSIVNHDDDGTPCSGSSADCTSREATGLTVTGTAANPVIYVTSSDFRIGSGSNGGNGDVDLDTNSGVVTRMGWNGTSWVVVDLVRGLPRSEENHATNGLEFVTINGNDYLLVAQGGHANGGAPSINFSLICEYALSAAVLAIDLDALEALPIQVDANGRSYIYDLPTLDDPTRANVNGITDPNSPSYNGIDVNDPWGGNDGLNQAVIVPGGPVQIFSPGYRNPYDLVVTQSGALYTTDNGANQGWGGLPVNEGGGTVTNAYDPNETGTNAAKPTADGEFVNNLDHLQLVTTNIQGYTFGSYYGGHPNPTRANPNGAGLYTAPALIGTTGAVFRTQKYDPNGSTPGSTTDPNLALPANWPPVPSANPIEGDWRGPAVANPDGPVDGAITTWPTNTNGIDEYTASNFGGAMKGNLLAGSNNGVLRRVQLNTNGTLQAYTESFITGLGGNALGITCNNDTDIFPGTIWTGTLNKVITVLEPIEAPNTPTLPLRINAGGPQITHNGNLFSADQYGVGGEPFANASAQVPTLYQTERTDDQLNFDYAIPLPTGNYTVILHFAEIYWGASGGGPLGTGQRVFDVSIEGNLIMDNYDIIADVGTQTTVTKTFNIAVADGQLDIEFSALPASGGVNQPKISALEVLVNAGENAAPVAVATAAPVSGTIPLTVNFAGSNSTDDVAVVGYLWDFNDGSPTVTTANPTHTFTNTGTYAVSLTVSDVEGLTDTTTINITVSENVPINVAPVAVIGATPIQGLLPLEVSFTGSGSTDDVAVVGYLWDFKDGTPTSAEADPNHTFSTKGTYGVTLTVTDAQGLTNSKRITITVTEESINSSEFNATLIVNPAKDVAQVQIIDQGATARQVAKVYVHDSSGRLVQSHDPKDIVANGLYQIPIANLGNVEMYYLIFKMADGDRLVMKLIVKN